MIDHLCGINLFSFHVSVHVKLQSWSVKRPTELLLRFGNVDVREVASRLGFVFSAPVSDLLASDLLSTIMDHFCFLFGLSRIMSCNTNAFLTFADTASAPISTVIRQCHNNANRCLAKI